MELGARGACEICKDLKKRRADVGKPEPKPAPVMVATAPQAPQFGEVIDLAGAAALRKPKPIVDKPDRGTPDHIRLGKAVIDIIQARGEDMLFTNKGCYYCQDGIWSMEPDGMAFRLNVEIETGAKAMDILSNTKVVNETRAWISRQERLCKRDVPWDSHGMVATLSGLVDPRTGACRPIRPDDYATWQIDIEYDPNAECPWWLQMLNDDFADRDPEDRDATIMVIQELLGVGLIDDKPRELSRALIFQGASNAGKSGLIEVLAGLFGQDVNSTPLDALEGSHGTMGFLKRTPWVLHEAFDQRKWHFSSRVKEIVTGDPIQINIKNGPMLSFRVKAPIFWGTNHPPQFKELTRHQGHHQSSGGDCLPTRISGGCPGRRCGRGAAAGVRQAFDPGPQDRDAGCSGLGHDGFAARAGSRSTAPDQADDRDARGDPEGQQHGCGLLGRVLQP